MGESATSDDENIDIGTRKLGPGEEVIHDREEKHLGFFSPISMNWFGGKVEHSLVALPRSG